MGEYEPMLNEPRSFQQNNTTSIDEHDEPTEPIRRANVDAFVPTIPNTVLPSDEEDVPAPKTSTQPFPHHYVQQPSSIQGSSQYMQPFAPSYPVLPAKPSFSGEDVPMAQPEAVNHQAQQKRAHRNIVPLAVGMCFIAVQMLLLFRFLLKLLSIFSDNAWVGAVYEVSNVFVLPFRALFLQLAIPQLFTVELYTLLAILAYGIVSRILVHTLKAVFKSR